MKKISIFILILSQANFHASLLQAGWLKDTGDWIKDKGKKAGDAGKKAYDETKKAGEKAYDATKTFGTKAYYDTQITWLNVRIDSIKAAKWTLPKLENYVAKENIPKTMVLLDASISLLNDSADLIDGVSSRNNQISKDLDVNIKNIDAYNADLEKNKKTLKSFKG